MADNYGQWFITKMFTDAEAAAVTSGKQITFKKMIASQDIFTQDDLATLTNSVLGTIDIKQQVNISTVLPSSGSYKVQGVFSNSTVTADYLMNTILLVGSYNGAEFLAAAQVANNAFKMPAASTGEQTIYTIAAQISVSNTATVSLTVDPDSIVTNAGLKVVTDAQAAKDSAQDVKISDLEVKDSQNVKITGNQSINGNKSFTQKITASISGNAGSATRLETPRKIDGVNFDGTDDVVLDVVHKTGDEEIGGNKTFNGNLKVTGTFTQPTVSTPAKLPYCTADKSTLVRVGNLVFFQGTFSATTTHAAGTIYNTGEYANETIPIGFRPNTLREDIRISKRSASGGEFVGRITLQTDGKMTDMRLYNSAFANTADAMVVSGGAVWATDDPWPSSE